MNRRPDLARAPTICNNGLIERVVGELVQTGHLRGKGSHVQQRVGQAGPESPTAEEGHHVMCGLAV